MCGIMAYIGKKQAYPILLDGLKKLEYRGYDSSGVAIMNGSLSLLKKQGKVSALVHYSQDKKTHGNIGLGHTRWATHGEPSDINAHPHQSQSCRYTMVHNGIIENHASIKVMLMEHGFTFQSETDTEVFVQLIEWHQTHYHLTTRQALARSLEMVEGSFAIVLFDLYNPTKLWAARRQSPLVIGLGTDECYIASDSMPLVSYVEDVIYIENDLIVEMNDQGSYQIFDTALSYTEQPISSISSMELDAQKGAFESFMLKEIHEQPSKVARLVKQGLSIDIPRNFDRIVITACGTSWHAGLIAEYLFEQYARIQVEVEYASEFRYRNPILSERDLVIGISQSGETADTMAALEMAKEAGCQTMALVNVPSSSIARMVDQCIDIKAGPEIGVASTKAFTNQLIAIYKLLLHFIEDTQPILAMQLRLEIGQVSHLMHQTIDNPVFKHIGHRIAKHSNALYLGRGTMYPIALEGALKLKEISYIHAEGYPAGEMKHGPIALIDEQMPVIAVCNNDQHLQKILSNIQEVKARKAIVILIKQEHIEIPEGLADFTINTPDCHEILSPLIQNIPLQLIAYHAAQVLDLDVDKPRNLAKSVTVE